MYLVSSQVVKDRTSVVLHVNHSARLLVSKWATSTAQAKVIGLPALDSTSAISIQVFLSHAAGTVGQ